MCSDRSRRRSFTYPSAVHDLGVTAQISPSSRPPTAAAGAHQLWSVERPSVPMFYQTSTSPPPSANAQDRRAEEFNWKEAHQRVFDFLRFFRDLFLQKRYSITIRNNSNTSKATTRRNMHRRPCMAALRRRRLVRYSRIIMSNGAHQRRIW
jgi:hypothetical protein